LRVNQVPKRLTRFESLLQAVPEALVGMDHGGVIRFVNRQAESLFGHSRDEMVGQLIEILLPEPFWEIYTQTRENYLADPRTRSTGLGAELIGLRRDGTDFPINVSISYVDTGDFLLTITAVADVTKRERAVQNAQLLAAVVEYSDDAIVGTSPEGVITSWNRAAERMYGYSSQEIIGRSGRVLAAPDQADQMDADLARTRAGEVVKHLELNHVRKDGTVFPVSVTVGPIRDDDGVIVGSSAVARDVTEQRRAFHAAQRMAAIVESSEDAIIGSTIEGVITSWNPAAERMFGYSSLEIVGKSAEYLTPQDQKGEIKAVLAKIKGGQHVEHLETKQVRKDGTVFPVSLTVSPVRDAHGAIVGTSVIHRDMTEHEHAAQYARSLIEASLDPLVAISPEGIINDVNEATVKVLGVPRAQLIGTPVHDYHTEPEKTDEIYQRVVAEGPLTDYPLTLRHRDGTLTDILCNLSTYRDIGGNVIGVLATGRVVTNQMLRHREVAQQ
jgi:PAS domain S-box-containing protein